MPAISYAQLTELVIFTYYYHGSGSCQINVGIKDIAKIEVTLTPKDEFGTVYLNYSKNFTFRGPCFAFSRTEGKFPNNFLGSFPVGIPTKYVVYFRDRTVKVFSRKQCGKMQGDYLEYLGRGWIK